MPNRTCSRGFHPANLHVLQYLEFDRCPVSFVISGGGGANLRKLGEKKAGKGLDAESAAGFTRLEVIAERFNVRHVMKPANLSTDSEKKPTELAAFWDKNYQNSQCFF